MSAGGPKISCSSGSPVTKKQSFSDFTPFRAPLSHAELETLLEVFGNRTVDNP